MLSFLIFLSLLFFFGVALLLWMFRESRAYQISRYGINVNKPLGHPLKVLHLSDIHFAWPKPDMDAFFDRLARETVDLVLITGDILDTRAGIPHCQRNLAKLHPRYGTFAVLGNHDYFDYSLWDSFVHNFPGQSYPSHPQAAQMLVDALEGMGIPVLRNETREITVEETPVLIHGLDDPTTGHANLRVAMESFDPAKLNILLTHTIDVFLDIGEGEIDLSFSGHSHGGQICLPWIGPLATHTTMGRAYASGIFHHKGALCSVSRGLGTSRYMPFRLLCPPEAILLTVYGK